jgi:hypothetical protein
VTSITVYEFASDGSGPGAGTYPILGTMLTNQIRTSLIGTKCETSIYGDPQCQYPTTANCTNGTPSPALPFVLDLNPPSAELKYQIVESFWIKYPKQGGGYTNWTYSSQDAVPYPLGSTPCWCLQAPSTTGIVQ